MVKVYSQYKDSGIPWLGQVPTGWDQVRGKVLFKNIKELNADRSNTNVLSLTLRGVVNNNPDDPEGLVPKDYATYQIFRKDDLVFKLIDLENLSTSRVGLVHEDGIMSPAYVRIVPRKKVNIKFFYYSFFDLYLRGIYNQLGAGVRATLSPNDLINLKLSNPPEEEQRSIVQFIEAHELLIHRYINTKRREIKLLHEQRNAIVKKAVCNGITSKVRLKPSGINWLGEIPEHWTTLHGFELFGEKQQKNTGMIEQTILSLSYGRIIIRPIEKLHGLVPASFETYQIVEPGDIIIRSTDLQNDKTSLRVGLVRNKGIITSAYLCLKMKEGLNPNYCYYLLHAYDVMKVFYGLGSGLRQNLGFIDFKRLPILLPPPEEQIEIVRFIDEKTKDVVDSIECLEKEIVLLRNYRVRLIFDAVTGKIDARNIKLPITNCVGDIKIVKDDANLKDVEDAEEVVNADE